MYVWRSDQKRYNYWMRNPEKKIIAMQQLGKQMVQ